MRGRLHGGVGSLPSITYCSEVNSILIQFDSSLVPQGLIQVDDMDVVTRGGHKAIDVIDYRWIQNG